VAWEPVSREIWVVRGIVDHFVRPGQPIGTVWVRLGLAARVLPSAARDLPTRVALAYSAQYGAIATKRAQVEIVLEMIADRAYFLLHGIFQTKARCIMMRICGLAFVMVFGCLLLTHTVTCTAEVTPMELCSAVEKAESSLGDISITYEWYEMPPLTRGALSPDDSNRILIPCDGLREFEMRASKMSDANGNATGRHWRLWSKERTTFNRPDGSTLAVVSETSYDGHVGKKFDSQSDTKKLSESGWITEKNPFTSIVLTPMGFSVFRPALDAEAVPLSEVLRMSNLVVINSEISRINDFNTICVNLLQETTRTPCRKIYCSVDHNYTPVRFEYINSGPKGSRVAFTVDILSLEQVGEGLYFPSSGIITTPGSPSANGFSVTAPIKINIGLSQEDFDVNFPAGTRVWDARTQKEFTAGTTP